MTKAKTITIPEANWSGVMGAAIYELDDDDTLVVRNENQIELAKRAITRSRPNLKVTIRIAKAFE